MSRVQNLRHLWKIEKQSWINNFAKSAGTLQCGMAIVGLMVVSGRLVSGGAGVNTNSGVKTGDKGLCVEALIPACHPHTPTTSSSSPACTLPLPTHTRPYSTGNGVPNANEIDTQNMKCTCPTQEICILNPTQPIFHWLALGFGVGGNAHFRFGVGDNANFRVFRYQHVRIPNAKLWRSGSQPTQQCEDVVERVQVKQNIHHMRVSIWPIKWAGN